MSCQITLVAQSGELSDTSKIRVISVVTPTKERWAVAAVPVPETTSVAVFAARAGVASGRGMAVPSGHLRLRWGPFM